MTDFYLEQLWKLFEFGEKVFRFDEEGIFILTSVDNNFCRMLGFGRAELMIRCHNRARELVYPPDLPELHDHVMRELKEKGEYTARYRMRKRSGELIWVWESGVMEYDLSGVRYVRNLVVNISDSEKMRKDRDITYDNLPGGVLRMLITETNFYIMQFNRQYIEMMGLKPEEYMGSSGLYTFPEDITHLRDHVTLQAANREPIDHEFRCRRGGAEEVHWFRLIGRFYEEVEDGSEYLCIMVDITERKQNSIQLEKERNRYHMAMRLTSGVLFEYDAKNHRFHVYNDIIDSEYIPCIRDGRFADLNEALFREDFIHKDDFGKFHQYVDSDSEYGTEVRMLAQHKQSGETSYQWFEVSIAKTWRHNRLRYVVGSMKHIEEREQDETVRWKLRNIFETHSGKMYERIACVDTETKKIWVYISEQSRFREYVPECSYDEYIQQVAEQDVHPEEQERFLSLMKFENMQRILQPGQLEEVLFFRVRLHGGGEYRYKCFRYSYLGDDIRTILISMQDMHRVREGQLKMEAANRKILASALNEEKLTMEVRRNFSAMLARELYAPLEFVDYELRRTWRENGDMDEMRDAVSYMRRVVKNISQFEKLEQGSIRFENKLFRLDDALREVLEDWKNKLQTSGIRMLYQLSIKWEYCYGDPAQLSQCIHHVIGNSVLASGERGTIDIWCNDEDQGNGISHLFLTIEDRGIPVNDSFFGRMYPMEDLEKVSSWSKDHKHMGELFSLVVSRKIIELLGGNIQLKRRKDNRNEIAIMIPFQRSQKPKPPTQVPVEADTTCETDLSGYTILVVERIPVTGSRLRLSRAQIDVAGSGQEAIQLWSGYSPGYFDAILVDGELPDMDYLEFTELLRGQDTGDCRTIPVFAMTEEISQEEIRDGICKGVNAVIEKPPNLRRLEQFLHIFKKGIDI